MKFSIITFLVLVLTFNGQAQVNTQLLENLMKQRPEMFGEIINHPNEYRLQLFYTQIDRDQYNIPHFKEYSYRLNPSEYFYPASTVKMPLAIMALDKINNLKIPGFTKSSTLYYDSIAARQETIYNNPYAVNGKQTVEQAIKEIFLVSDNNAANRLFEFIGQENIHKKLAEKGYKDAYIRNRLELGRTQEESRQTQAIDVFDDNGVSYGDMDTYPVSSFLGTKLVSYKVGNSVIDKELGFSLSYLNINNVGDIEFNFDWTPSIPFEVLFLRRAGRLISKSQFSCQSKYTLKIRIKRSPETSLTKLFNYEQGDYSA